MTSLLSPKWLGRLENCSRLLIGFSGGLDSTVLLHTLTAYPSLANKLIAVHVNHGISPHSLSWQQHCQQFCLALSIPFISESVEFNRQSNIEEGARIARYDAFSALLQVNDCLLLGHHLNDQAETVLLQLFRGAGIDGLAAMPEWGSLGLSAIARPFLAYTRCRLEDYALTHQLSWIDDESNVDIAYSRNYLRQQIMPAIIARWPAALSSIARTAQHCQQAKMNLNELAFYDSPDLIATNTFLAIESLNALSSERIINVLRVWLQQNHVSMPSTAVMNEIINNLLFASSDAVPLISWDQIGLRRYQNVIYLDKKESVKLPTTLPWPHFPESLVWDGGFLSAQKANRGLVVPAGAKLCVRFRSGGETMIWRGQTKKLKKLFQEWNIPPWERDRMPLFYINELLAAVGSVAISDLFFMVNAVDAWELLTKS